MDELQKALIQGFKRNRNAEFGDYANHEMKSAEQIVVSRFNN